MPDGSGLSFIRRMRAEYPDTICMLMTAYDDITVVRNAINQGHVYYYITKPWEEEALSLVLAKAFEKCHANLELKRKNEALQRAYYELDKLLYSASHDMRTPLSGILGLSRLIRREIAGQEEALRYTDLIEESTNRMLGVLDTLSDYSLLRAEDSGPNSFDVEQAIKGIIERCKARYADSGVKFNSVVVCKGDTEIPFKRKKMELLLRKLIENAFLFRQEGSSRHTVEVSVTHSDAILRVEVSDSGQGILPNRMEEIFGLFYRGSNQSEGVGMGLYIARELVRELDGTISVTSNPGSGSTFSVALPIG